MRVRPTRKSQNSNKGGEEGGGQGGGGCFFVDAKDEMTQKCCLLKFR